MNKRSALGVATILAAAATALAAPPTGPAVTQTKPAAPKPAPVAAPQPAVIAPSVQPVKGLTPAGSPALDKLSPAAGLTIKPVEKLRGFADLHTHPMSYLGFGKKAMHGAPDEDLLLPASTTLGCGQGPRRGRSMAEALGGCNATHGGWGTDNTCGDHLRAGVINNALDSGFWYTVGMENNLHNDHPHAGYPKFDHWPHHSSILHQQMWWEWLKRAHAGGLRVMVALTVNSETLAQVLNGDGPYDDKSVANEQIDETVRFVNRHRDFMEIAYSAADAERIVRDGRLAVILGMEVDKLGNFGKPGVRTDDAAVRAEIRRLYDKGIRYAFPIHLIDNAFGGTAVYQMLMNMANRNQNGSFYSVIQSPDPNVSYRAHFVSNDPGVDSFASHGFYSILAALSGLPAPCFDVQNGCFPGTWKCCGSYSRVMDILSPTFDFEAYKRVAPGHVNAKGLTRLGEVAIKEMMRLGMLIDVDHMSERALRRTVEVAEGVRGGYPLMIGHNGVRGHDGNERAAPEDIVTRVAALDGMMGLGTAHANPSDFVVNYKKAKAVLQKGSPVAGLGLGTDVNGFEPLPHRGAGESQESPDHTVNVPGDAWNQPPAHLSCAGAEEKISVRTARIGCLDIQRSDNLTGLVALACNDKRQCDYKAPSEDEYRKRGVTAATRSMCTQAMEIVYRCEKHVTPPTNSANFYRSFFAESGITTKQKKPDGRSWDYIEEGGVSHYGLMPEFLHEVKQNDASVYEDVMSSADAFVRTWKKAESVKSAVSTGPTVGTFSYTFAPLATLCPSTKVAGDGEFDGHGPRVKGSVALSIDSTGSRVRATVTLSARETTADWSEARGSWTVDVGEPAPAGLRYTAIVGPKAATFDQVLSGGGRVEPFEGCDGGEHLVVATVEGKEFARIMMVGDTGGGDISTDADCHCDTRINSIELAPVQLTLAPR